MGMWVVASLDLKFSRSQSLGQSGMPDTVQWQLRRYDSKADKIHVYHYVKGHPAAT